MGELIAWVIVIVFSIGLPLLMVYGMGDKHYMDKGQFKRRSVPSRILNGLLNISIVWTFLSVCTGFLALIFWAFETVMGA